HVLEERAGVTLAAVAEPVRVGRARPRVAERRKPGAVGAERQPPRLVQAVDRATLLVVDVRSMGDPPARVADDALPERGRRCALGSRVPPRAVAGRGGDALEV